MLPHWVGRQSRALAPSWESHTVVHLLCRLETAGP